LLFVFGKNRDFRKNVILTRKKQLRGEAASLDFAVLLFSVAVVSVKEQEQEYENEEQYFAVVSEKSKASSF